MSFLKKLFENGNSEKDVRYYANRLSGQMYKISKVGIKIESYLPKAYQSCANRAYIEASLSAFKSVGGQSGDAALEIYGDIDKDIETMRSFINDWSESANADKKVMSLAEELCVQLEKLKEFIVDTPPDMMAGCKKIVMQKRSGAHA
jgi:hypothetical protein